MKSKWKILMGGCVAVLACAALGAWLLGYFDGEPWSDDFEASLKKAAAKEKDVLVDFTGSDWCGWCIKLKKEVFSKEEFLDGVKDGYVLVEIDYPKKKSKLTPETIAQNKELAERYPVSGYPTILLLDTKGVPFAKTGYRKGGPEAYVSHLKELSAIRIKRDKEFSKSAKLAGVEKARLLVGTLNSMNLGLELTEKFYGDKIELVRQADPSDETGYIHRINQEKKLNQFQGQLNELLKMKKVREGIALTEDVILSGGFEAPVVQQLVVSQARFHAMLGEFDIAFATLDKAVAISPQSPFRPLIEKTREGIAKAKLKSEQPKEEAEKPVASPEAPE